MITPAHVRADVVDIRAGSMPSPESLVVDANVMYWVFYPNFATLSGVRGRLPQQYQTRFYPNFWSDADGAGCEFYTAGATLAEFAKLSEFAELEARWLLDAARPTPPNQHGASFNPAICKFCRYHYSVQLTGIRQDIDAVIAGLRGTVALLHQFPTSEAEYQATNALWQNSSADFPDATLVATALDQGYTSFLSDDADLATFDKITLYTANDRAVTAAGLAGKLHQ